MFFNFFTRKEGILMFLVGPGLNFRAQAVQNEPSACRASFFCGRRICGQGMQPKKGRSKSSRVEWELCNHLLLEGKTRKVKTENFPALGAQSGSSVNQNILAWFFVFSSKFDFLIIETKILPHKRKISRSVNR
jgi:hypothetical protein